MDKVAGTTSVLSVPAGSGAAGLRRVETALRDVVLGVALVLGVGVALVFGMGLGVGVEVAVGSEPSAVAGLSWGAVVDLVVVAAAPAAQQDAVGRARRAAFAERLGVVGFGALDRFGAALDPAAGVAGDQGDPQVPGDGALGPPDVQDLPGAVEDDPGQGAVAGQPVQGPGADRVAGQGQLPQARLGLALPAQVQFAQARLPQARLSLALVVLPTPVRHSAVRRVAPDSGSRSPRRCQRPPRVFDSCTRLRSTSWSSARSAPSASSASVRLRSSTSGVCGSVSRATATNSGSCDR